MDNIAYPYKHISRAGTNATLVRAGFTQVCSIEISSVDATPVYLKIYNKATAPTVGTDVPVKVLMIPGSSGGLLGTSLQFSWTDPFIVSNGLGFALTTGAQDSDTGAVAANEVVVNFNSYQGAPATTTTTTAEPTTTTEEVTTTLQPTTTTEEVTTTAEPTTTAGG